MASGEYDSGGEEIRRMLDRSTAPLTERGFIFKKPDVFYLLGALCAQLSTLFLGPRAVIRKSFILIGEADTTRSTLNSLRSTLPFLVFTTTS